MNLTATRRRIASRTILPIVASLGVLAVLIALPPLAPDASGPAAVQAWHGRITARLDPHRPAPGGAGFLPDTRVLVLEGPLTGSEIDAYLQGPGGQQTSGGYVVGEDVVVTATGDPSGETTYTVADRWRLPQLIVLAAIFVLAVVLVAGQRGARALIGLGITIATILKVLLPLLVLGIPPIPVAVVCAMVMTVIVIGLAEGLGSTATAAILGTSASLALTAILAALATAFAAFTATEGSDLVALTLPNGEGLDLRGLLLAAFMIGSIGVLDDVTVTQAAAVAELERAGRRGRDLYGAAFAIGRSHIAATINTLFLAYAGVSLPLLVYLIISNQPTTLLVNGESIAIEIVRTLVGSLGIVAAVPLTTVLAIWLSPVDDKVAHRDRGSATARLRLARSPLVGLGLGLAIIGIVTGSVGLLVGQVTSTGPRFPEPPDQLGAIPSGGEPSPAASTGAASSQEPPSPDIPVFAIGQDLPLFDDQANQVGTIRVVQVEPGVATGDSITISVELRYEASAPLTIDPGAWRLHSESGAVPATTPTDPSTHPTLSGSLRAGEARTGWLTFDVPLPASAMSLDYLTLGVTLFSVALE